MNSLFFTQTYNKISDKISRNVLVSTDQGLMIINRFDFNDKKVGHGQWFLDHGNCNTIEAEICLRQLKNENPVILDIGANIGTITNWIARTIANSTIYCFEPQPQVFNMLCGNIAINNFYNVRAFHYALGAKEEIIRCDEPNYFQNNDFGTFSLIEKKIETTDKKIIIEVKTLDWFVKTYELNHIDLIKIDAEGMDLDVLKGGENSILEFSPAIFIEHSDDKKSILEEIQNFLSDFDYKNQVVGNNILFTK